MNEDENTLLDFCFKSVVRHVLKECTEDYNKEKKFTPEILLKLRCIFGPTFEKALELYEAKKVTRFTVELTRNVNKDRTICCFYEVKGQNSQVYTIFPNINFCSCLAFEVQVLEEQNTFTCKHVLTVWLTSITSENLNFQTIPESKFCEVLSGRVLY